MATCSPQELLDSANCFACLTGPQLAIIQTRLLCQILQVHSTTPVTCDVQTLLNNAACFWGLTGPQLAVIQTQLLCEILDVGASTGCLLCSAASDPVAAPACDCSLFYRRDNGTMWYWDAGSASWVPLIGP